MSNTYYRLYVDSVLQMAKTLVLKSEASAEGINQFLTDYKQYPVDTTAPTTWKYYLNLAGRYHPTDTPMTVLSLDTQTLISFDPETLRQHRATRREYMYGSRYYNDLVRQYPDQEQLILGILNPVDINRAIAAPDHSILWIDPTSIESNETNLVFNLQDRINRFESRWVLKDYAMVDELYQATHLAILYLCIPAFILNIRLANCRTRFAHSFHIRQYLASHGRLDGFLDTLSKKQMLFLYRNITYIQRNAGKKDTFNWLVQNVMTDRGLPLAQYEMRHNLSEQPTNLYPTVDLKRTPVNAVVGRETLDTRTVVEILDKQLPLARDNRAVLDYAAQHTVDIMQDSLNNRLATKVLESSVVDRTDSDPFTLTDTLLNNWLYFSTQGLYPTVVSIPNPKTGESFRITAKDAFALFLYTYNKARGIVLPSIPAMEACRVRKLTLPTRAELLSLVERRYVEDGFTDAALDNQPVLETLVSVEAFNVKCRDLWRAQRLHRDLYAYREHYVSRGQVEALAGFLYCDYPCDLGTGIDYDEWLKVRGLDLASFTDAQLELLAQDTLKTVTGVGLNVATSLKELQASMMRLMGQLSSYTIQFIPEINSDAIKVVDWAVARLGDEYVTTRDHVRVVIDPVYIQRFGARGHGYVYLDLTRNTVEIKANARERHRVSLDIGLDWNLHGGFSSNFRGVMPSVYVDFGQPGDHDLNDLKIRNTEDYQPLLQRPQLVGDLDVIWPEPILNGLYGPGMFDLDALTEEDVLNGLWPDLKDRPLTEAVVDPDLDGFAEGLRPLIEAVTKPNLDGFDYLGRPLVRAVTSPNLDAFDLWRKPLAPDVDTPALDGFILPLLPLAPDVDEPALDGFVLPQSPLDGQVDNPTLDGFTLPLLSLDQIIEAPALDGFTLIQSSLQTAITQALLDGF